MSVDNVQGIRDVLTPESRLGKGISWPPREDPTTGDFARSEAEASISDCLIHLLTTVVGELSPMTNFGTRLDELLFSAGEEGLIQDVLESVRDAIRLHEKRITVIDLGYTLRPVTTSTSAIEIDLTYRIVATGAVQTFIQRLPPAGVSS